MNKNSVVAFGGLCAYIASVMGLAIGCVGTVPECTSEPFTWELPFIMFVFLALPALLGYLVGIDE